MGTREEPLSRMPVLPARLEMGMEDVPDSRPVIPSRKLIDLVRIPPGSFIMGSTRGLPLEEPVHEVVISQVFFIGRYPVTQAQWLAVMGDNPSGFPEGGNYPVENLSWEDAVEFCRRLSGRGEGQYRLPSEAEWEYVCRAGSTTEFHFGGEDLLDDYAWHEGNSGERTHAVGLKLPNAWGLHDMMGNVWEWCQDVWHGDYTGAPGDGSAWMEDAATQPRRCLRGGAWNYDAMRCRSAYRSFEWKEFRADHIGIRVVCEDIRKGSFQEPRRGDY